jgi:hypothetical protein
MADQLVVAALRVVFLLYVTLVLVHSTLERLYALRSRRQRRAEPQRPAEPDEWPAVDVVIPCFNSGSTVRRLAGAPSDASLQVEGWEVPGAIAGP